MPDTHADARQDLESIPNRIRHCGRQLQLLFEHAPDSVTKRRALGVDRQVHFAGADLDRAGENLIAHLDGGRFTLPARRRGALTGPAEPLAKHVEIADLRIAPVERHDDSRAGGGDGRRSPAGREREIAVGFGVEGIAPGVRQHAIVDGERHHQVPAGQSLRHQLHRELTGDNLVEDHRDPGRWVCHADRFGYLHWFILGTTLTAMTAHSARRQPSTSPPNHGF